MLQILAHPDFRRLFLAQLVALLGTGLLTIALGLLAFDLAGEKAGQVLGLALTIKMLAYVGLSPITTALVARMDRRKVLIMADLVRAGAALCLPFIDAVWQIYVLIFVLQAASATFSPTFQAVIPDILPDEGDYTRALSLSRLAYDIEALFSPVLAAILLSVMQPSGLFVGTALGFVLSGLLVARTRLPRRGDDRERPFMERLTSGSRIYLSTPRLRGLLALTAVYAAASGLVFVLSVVVARSVYAGSAQDLAVLAGAYGAGSMLVALLLPRVLEKLVDRTVMLFAASAAAVLLLCAGFWAVGFGWPDWSVVLIWWAMLGAVTASIATPSGRLLRRSSRPKDRPAVFAAHFALSHACWLVTYPLAGFLGSAGGVGVTMIVMGVLSVGGVLVARRVWPAA